MSSKKDDNAHARVTARIPEPPTLPPTHDELPYDDGRGMEAPRHRWQRTLLIESLEPWLQQRHADTGKSAFVGGNMFVYFWLAQLEGWEFRGPDVFVGLNAPLRERRSWVVWEEFAAPNVVIELLSPSTRESDKTDKKEVYRSRLCVPEYYWFDPFDPEDFAGFGLCGGIYEPIERDDHGRLACDCLGLQLGPWRGTFHGIDTTWLRWYTKEGHLLLTDAEREAQRANKLACKLRELGVDPDSVA